MINFAGLGEGAGGDTSGVGDSAGVGEATGDGLAFADGLVSGEFEACCWFWVQAAATRTKPATKAAGTTPDHILS